MLVEFLHVLLGRADHVEAELEGMVAGSGKMGRDADGKYFAMRKIDKLRSDRGEGDAELHVAEVVV